MKHLALAVLILSLAASVPAFADEWSKTYSLSGRPDLRIDTSDANIRVTTWDQNTIEAKVITERYKIGEGGIRVEEHQSGDQVEIDVKFPHHEFSIGWNDHRRVDVIIQMPREGKVNLRTSDGRIELTGLKGDMDLHSGDGSEQIDGVDGKLHATTGDGHIRANGRFDELDLKTGDGHLDARAASGSTMASPWRLETGDGNASLEIPSDFSAEIDLHTGDGHIDLDNVSIATGEALREGHLHGKLKGGGSLLTIHTGDGSIHLRQS
jgi:DUF4097 and DUF4098 domain-containing protein YvlB